MNRLLKRTIMKIGLALGVAFVGHGAIAVAKNGDNHYDNDPEQKTQMEGSSLVLCKI